MISKGALLRFAITLAVVILANAEASRGQAVTQQGGPSAPPTHSKEVCDPNGPPSARPYIDCALLLDGVQLRRGYKGEVVGRARFAPIPMGEIVVGDSAKHYAQLYETDTWISQTLMRVGEVTAVSAWYVGRKKCSSFMCVNGAAGHGVRVTAVTAFSLGFLSLPFRSGADKAGARAVWWNNALLVH